MAKTAPSPIDVLDFQFKLQCRLKIFENDNHDTFKKSCSLVTAASRYGILFVGTSSPRFQVIEIQDIQNYTVKDGDLANYKRRNITLPSVPKYLSVNCDSTKLCVVVEKDGCVKAIIYDVTSFLKQNVSILQEIRLSATPGVGVLDLCWNPTVPSMLVACKDDGTLGLYSVKDNGIEIKELPKTTGTTCVCWSPKGKQIVIGSINGKLTQYKLDLQVAKVINAPPIGNLYPIGLQWISNYQFIAIYKGSGDDAQMSLLVVDAPKNAEPTFTNYDDVCYSYGNARPHQFYMLQQPLWNILLVASSNSMEVGVMHLDKETWTQWILTDSARAELPLNAAKQDTLPVGMAFDVSSNKPIPWGESELPPAPYLFLLSHQGVLCSFHTINLKQEAAKICVPPEALSDRSGLANFTMGDHGNVNAVQVTSIANVVKPTPVAQTTVTLQQPFAPFATPQSTMFTSPLPITSQPTPTLFNKPTIQPIATTPSLFGMQTQPFTALKPDSRSTTITKPQVEVFKKPEENETNQKPIVTKPMVTQQQVKQVTTVETKVTTPQKATPGGILAINEETERLLAQMMKEECINLDMEIEALIMQGGNVKVDLGSDAEATSIVEGAAVLQDFLKEINEISNTQVAEIHGLKQHLIQTWVWYEEARSRFATYKDPTLKSLLLAQPLDAASERKLDEIRHLIYYLESQLVQANAALDEQWECFQDSCKKKISTRVPTIEAIYQVMVKQNATLQKQVYILKDISMRVRSKLKNVNVPRLLVSLDSTGELEEQLKNLHMEPKDLIQIRYEKVLKRQKKLSKPRIDKLKQWFQNGNVSHITVKKPQNSSLMQVSGLAVAPFSPIAPKKPQKDVHLDFVQSTPLPEVTKARSIIMESNPTPPVVVNLFKQEMKSVGGDVKTSAFVPMVNTKGNFFGTGNLEQNSLFTQKPQKILFNAIPSNTNLLTQSSTANNFFGTPIASEIGNKPPISVPSNVSVSIIKTTSSGNLTTKSNAFPQFSIPTTQNFSFLTNKPAISIEKLSTSKAVVETENTKPAFSSIFGQSTKPNTAVSNSNSSITFGSNIAKSPTVIFGDKSMFSMTNESKPFAIEKPAAIFGNIPQNNMDQIKTTTTFNISTSAPQNIAITTTSTPSLFSQIFGPNASSAQSETPKTFEPTIVVTTSAFEPSTTISSSTPPNSVVNTTVMQKPQTAAIVTTKSVASINDQTVSNTTSTQSITSSSLPSMFGNTTTTTSIFVQPITTSKSTGVVLTTSTQAIISQSTTVSTISQPTSNSTTPTSVFGTTAVSSPFAPSTTTSIFGQKPNLFGSTTTTPILQQPTVQTPSIFAKTASTFGQSTTGVSTMFGQTPAIFSSPVTSAIPMFSSATTTFGQSTIIQPTLAGQALTSTVTPNAFGTATTTTAVFGGQQPTTSSSIFGQAISTPSIFGQPASTSSIFGQPTSSASVFGQASLPPTSTSSVFRQTTPNSSIFGQPTSTSSIFGQPTFTQTSTPSVFGQTTSTPSIFGQPTSIPSVFGQQTSASSAFGQTSSAPGIFGQPINQVFGQTTTPTSSIFGQSPFGQSTTSVFGQPTSTTSVFGQPTTSASSVFGQDSFGSNSIFKTSTSNVFGSTPFGQTPTTTSIFNTSSPFGSSSVFGGNTTNNAFTKPAPQTFGTTDNLNFGRLNTGGSPATTSSATNVFGSPSFNSFRTADKDQTFGGGNIFETASTTSTTSVFGNSPFSKTTPSFGGPATFGASPTFSQPSGFGSNFATNATFGNPNQPGPFSSTGSTVSQSGFGSPPAFQKSSFISQPTFGPQPSAFGSPATFGASTFGGSPSFGSPSRVFGSTEGFGVNPPQQNSTFANLATQPTTGFGSIAQQAPVENMQQPSFAGGSSFTSWR